MIYILLDKISSVLNENIRLRFNLNRDVVKVQSVVNETSEGYVSVSLINLERETSGGISFNRTAVSSRYSTTGSPLWQFNMYLLIAVVFPDKQYTESLKLFPEILNILQANHVITVQQAGIQFVTEPLNVSFQELSNIWSVAGGTYHPSVILKVKYLQVDGNNLTQVATNIENVEIAL